jgi:uncharacterized protein (UPF0335 family)
MIVIGKNTISGELLRGFVERIENIDAQIKDLGQDKRVIMAEAKKANLVPAAIGFVLKKRKMKPSDRAECEVLEDMYLHAMGMGAANPLFRAVGMMEVDIMTRESVIEAMKKFVPAGGSIQVEAGGGLPVRLTRGSDGAVSVTEVVRPQTARRDDPKAWPVKADVPDVDAAGAQQLGAQAFAADVAIIANPFPYGDPRRPRWDAGWRDEAGHDGMGA